MSEYMTVADVRGDDQSAGKKLRHVGKPIEAFNCPGSEHDPLRTVAKVRLYALLSANTAANL
jgi:hypothetical protein